MELLAFQRIEEEIVDQQYTRQFISISTMKRTCLNQGNSDEQPQQRKDEELEFPIFPYSSSSTAAPASSSLSPTAQGSTMSPALTIVNTRVSADPEMLFPHKLFVMLHDADKHSFHDIVSWGKDSYGAFKVHHKRDFERVVLPKYFKMTKYKSFTRQLHNYDFLWIRTGRDKGGCT
jgi:hypothetical protein